MKKPITRTLEEVMEIRRARSKQRTPEEIEAAKQRRREQEKAELEIWKRYEADPLLMKEYLAKRNAQCDAANESKKKRQAEQTINDIYANNQQAEGLGVTKAQLARELKKNPDTIRHHVKVLREAGRVKSEKYFDKREADEIRQRVRQKGRKRNKS